MTGLGEGLVSQLSLGGGGGGGGSSNAARPACRQMFCPQRFL